MVTKLQQANLDIAAKRAAEADKPKAAPKKKVAKKKAAKKETG